ncbi:MAG: arginyltransferase [Hyphomonadaceae bacterium]|nr:arginyltransferase [Hyphomonadaceae bacterium]GIK48149.1 MAG: putative arginyl-tRNA--protein transferase [Alphaproteobacteria bacterium]
MTKPFPTKNLRFYLTAPSPCPYLPGKRERKVFTALDGFDAGPLHDALTNAGFRRSQNIAYRPSCDGCDACISARVPVERFAFSRRWRKVMIRNADLARALKPARATEEQYRLLRRYLNSRHAEGGMADMTFGDYAAMVEETAVHTHIVEYRFSDGAKKGELAALALVDALGDGLSMVYSCFDPDAPKRSLGVYTILDHIQQARAAGFSYVYLGYWIPGSDKMDYKAGFRPLELLLGGEWRPYAPVEF